MIHIWYLVLHIGVTGMMVPSPYQTKDACEAAGKSVIEKNSSYFYLCVEADKG